MGIFFPFFFHFIISVSFLKFSFPVCLTSLNAGLVATARPRTAGTQVLEVQARAVGWRERGSACSSGSMRVSGSGRARARRQRESACEAAARERARG